MQTPNYEATEATLALTAVSNNHSGVSNFNNQGYVLSNLTFRLVSNNEDQGPENPNAGDLLALIGSSGETTYMRPEKFIGKNEAEALAKFKAAQLLAQKKATVKGIVHRVPLATPIEWVDKNGVDQSTMVRYMVELKSSDSRDREGNLTLGPLLYRYLVSRGEIVAMPADQQLADMLTAEVERIAAWRAVQELQE